MTRRKARARVPTKPFMTKKIANPPRCRRGAAIIRPTPKITPTSHRKSFLEKVIMTKWKQTDLLIRVNTKIRQVSIRNNSVGASWPSLRSTFERSRYRRVPRFPWLAVTAESRNRTMQMQHFERAFQALSVTRREALLLVGGSGFSYEDAAEAIGCAERTLESRVCRARSELGPPKGRVGPARRSRRCSVAPHENCRVKDMGRFRKRKNRHSRRRGRRATSNSGFASNA